MATAIAIPSHALAIGISSSATKLAHHAERSPRIRRNDGDGEQLLLGGDAL
jgi:hypothetical protein